MYSMNLGYNVFKSKFYAHFNAGNEKSLTLLVFEWDRFQYNIAIFCAKSGKKLNF